MFAAHKRKNQRRIIMANHTQTSGALVVHLRPQNQVLNRLAMDAEHTLRSPLSRRGSNQRATIIQRLEALRDQMVRHSEQELSGGCLEEVVCGRPELTHQATCLEHEHQVL